MCGIAGFLQLQCRRSPERLRELASGMADSIRHRGPDDGGVWADADAGIALSMRRLAILDLSPAGHQPMTSSSGRYVIVFNGEIYNCEDLRRDVVAENGSIRFRGHSDTEVMLAAFECWGILESVQRFNGMFAFAVWDKSQRTLTLARDRFGEKPLYYSFVGSAFVFGSELKALRTFPGFSDSIDLGSVALFLRRNCIPAPYSIYAQTKKLPPATLLTVSATDFAPALQSYWSLDEVAKAGRASPFGGTEEEAIEQLDALLRDAVRIRMYADVPLGAFLSGGIDSSTIVSLMQAQTGIPVRTFTIGLQDSEFDEASHAKCVAEHLKTDHTEFVVTPEEAMSVVPRLPEIYDEPFADSSQIPTFLVSQLARRYVTVSLSGDGGDENFGGYNRHLWVERLWNSFRPFPRALRRFVASSITLLSPDAWDALSRSLSSVLPARFVHRMPGYKLHKLASLMDSGNTEEMYSRLTSHWFHPEELLRSSNGPDTLADSDNHHFLDNTSERMMLLDSMSYLPDDILVKLDRATMAVSLEGRVPLLDHRVAEFAWRLPLSFKVRYHHGKWILRQVLYKYVPRELVERPKSGFGIPLASWLRGPLRDWAESLLDESRLRSGGIFNAKPIRRAWAQHLSGRGSYEYQLWDVLMFQAWLENSRRASESSYASCAAH